jgi:catechol 2,3-dioxygenase-like lactoylglutathione lyase family enzyme
VALDIQRVMHLNANCSDLARSLHFYEDIVGLKAGTHTNPKPQPGAGFGLPGDIQWDAYMMCDSRGPESVVLDLLQWHSPEPMGTPYQEPNHLGMFRLCVLAPDLDMVYARAQKMGVPCESPPVDVPVIPEENIVVRALFCRDPDGTLIEFIEQPGGLRLIHVNMNCSDLEHSSAWYREVLGLEVRGRSRPGPVSGEAFGLPGLVRWEADFLYPPGDESFALDLLEWKDPAPIGQPYASANHLGLYRMAFLVADIHASHAELLKLGVQTSKPVFLDMGPEVPVDGVWAIFFPDPDGSCLELIQSPV